MIIFFFTQFYITRLITQEGAAEGKQAHDTAGHIKVLERQIRELREKIDKVLKRSGGGEKTE